MFSDVLSEALGVYTNGAALRQCRRHKFEMQEQCKKAGVRSIHQMSVDEKTVRADILVHTLLDARAFGFLVHMAV